MSKHYSPSTGGFYDDALHGETMPADAVAITDALYVTLISGQTSAQTIVMVGGLPALQAVAVTVAQLIAYAEAKQAPVLAALQVTHALKDGTATLTTMCNPGSITFLNSLAAWATFNMSVSPTPPRTFYNLDGSAVQVSPSDLAEFLSAVGAAVQSTFDAVAKVRTAITSSPATITTLAQIDAFAWPTAAS